MIRKDPQQKLVGGVPTHLKNMSSSIGMIIPNIWENKTCSSHHQPVLRDSIGFDGISLGELMGFMTGFYVCSQWENTIGSWPLVIHP